MKKTTGLIVLAVLLIVMISGCRTIENEKIKVVCTTFAAYDWTSRIIGEANTDIDTVLLCDSTADMHSYQASADDIIELSLCDILIYTGGQSEKWVSDAVASNEKAEIINLLEILGTSAKIERHTEGMETGEHSSSGHEDTEYDEHVWLSLKNAVLFCNKIADTLAAADPKNSQLYLQNAKQYIKELEELDSLYQSTVTESKKDTLIFADRFPFVYLMDDYGIKYYAAFPGCSTETQASFETILFLAQKADELSVNFLLTVDGSQSAIAAAVAENTHNDDMQILSMDSMQAGGQQEIQQGKTYLSVMRSNLDIIKTALN